MAVSPRRCACPYEYGGYCKHIVAVLLKASERHTDIVERPALSEQLADLDKVQLIVLLARRLDVDDSLAACKTSADNIARRFSLCHALEQIRR